MEVVAAGARADKPGKIEHVAACRGLEWLTCRVASPLSGSSLPSPRLAW
jgi:hypothetical protein